MKVTPKSSQRLYEYYYVIMGRILLSVSVRCVLTLCVLLVPIGGVGENATASSESRAQLITATTTPINSGTTSDEFKDCVDFVRHPRTRLAVTIGFALVIVVALLANGLLLLAYCKHWRRLVVEPHDCLIFNIIACDFAYVAGCHVYEWFDYLLLPCTALGQIACFVRNLFDIPLGNQNSLNVALLVYNRYCMLRYGARYKVLWTVAGTLRILAVSYAINTVLLYIVPEIIIPFLVDEPRINSYALGCRAEMYLAPRAAHYINALPFYVSYVAIIIFSTLTVVQLVKRRYGGATVEPHDGAVSVLAAAIIARKKAQHKRGLIVTFGTIFVYFLTALPMLFFTEFQDSAILQSDQGKFLATFAGPRTLLYILYANPALDPFVYALLMPKMRAAVRDVLGFGVMGDV